MPASSAPTAEQRAAGAATALQGGFESSVARFPDRPALFVAGETYTYAELGERAAAIAATLAANTPTGGERLAAVFAYRTPAAFAGILGVLMAGRGYVPLNRNLPAARTRLMLERSGARAMVADAASAEQLPEVLDGMPATLVVLPDEADVSGLRERLGAHTVLGAADLEPAGSWERPAHDEDDVAYLLFTSGSTGVPKGVMVTHRNVCGLMRTMVDRYGVTERDRISQTHELTFDVSVWDIFVAWLAGACLCCPSQKELIHPGRFIRGERITIWFSVPSTAVFMRRLGMLKPAAYPGLRHSLFAGEPLPVEVAEAWRRAAPNSTVENLYGPTELTIVCLGYRWEGEASRAFAEADVVPVGEELPGMRTLVADAELRPVAPGETGELLMTGPQVTPGYWKDPERTAQSYVVPPGEREVFYRTGDRVRRPLPGRPMTYLGRLDHQIKVRGVRVELGEVEAAVREATGVDAVVAVGWPVSATGADGIVAFVGDTGVDVAAVRARLAARLPVHMIPRRFELLDGLPLNASGKFDRRRLTESLREASR